MQNQMQTILKSTSIYMMTFFYLKTSFRRWPLLNLIALVASVHKNLLDLFCRTVSLMGWELLYWAPGQHCLMLQGSRQR